MDFKAIDMMSDDRVKADKLMKETCAPMCGMDPKDPMSALKLDMKVYLKCSIQCMACSNFNKRTLKVDRKAGQKTLAKQMQDKGKKDVINSEVGAAVGVAAAGFATVLILIVVVSLCCCAGCAVGLYCCFCRKSASNGVYNDADEGSRKKKKKSREH